VACKKWFGSITEKIVDPTRLRIASRASYILSLRSMERVSVLLTIMTERGLEDLGISERPLPLNPRNYAPPALSAQVWQRLLWHML
jgi:hypothetical protein